MNKRNALDYKLYVDFFGFHEKQNPHSVFKK